MNSNNSKENSEVKRNAQVPEKIVIAAIQMMYNEHEKDINALGFKKELLTENENSAKEISIPAFDSGEHVVTLPQSLLNEMAANRDRRVTEEARKRKMKKQRYDNTMQK